MGACEAEIWRRADAKPDWTPDQLARSARRVITRHDPHALERAHEQCVQDSDVRLTAEPGTGMAWLSAYLPLADGFGIKLAVDRAALRARAMGDLRPLGLLRAKALRDMAEHFLSAVITGTKPRVHGRPVEIQIAAPLETVMGWADHPGEIPNYGAVPASVLRDLVKDAAVRLVTYHPETGILIDYGRTTYRAPADLAAHVIGTWQGSAGPGSNAPAAGVDLDHLEAWDDGGRTCNANLIPIDRRTHRARTHTRLAAARRPDGSIDRTTPLGQTATTNPYDWRLGP